MMFNLKILTAGATAFTMMASRHWLKPSFVYNPYSDHLMRQNG